MKFHPLNFTLVAIFFMVFALSQFLVGCEQIEKNEVVYEIIQSYGIDDVSEREVSIALTTESSYRVDCYSSEDLLSLLSQYNTNVHVQLAWVPVYHIHTEVIADNNGPNNLTRINGTLVKNSDSLQEAYEWTWSTMGTTLSTQFDPSFSELLPISCVGVFPITLQAEELSTGDIYTRTEWVSYTYEWLLDDLGLCDYPDAPLEVEINWPFYPQWDLNNDFYINSQDLLTFLSNYC